jgi:hypothetical protein
LVGLWPGRSSRQSFLESVIWQELPIRGTPSLRLSATGFRDLGYNEGKNIQVEFRYTEGRSDSPLKFVIEFVQLKPDVLVIAQGQAAIRAAQQVSKTIPIVIKTTVTPSPRGSSKAWRIQAEISRGLLQ